MKVIKVVVTSYIVLISCVLFTNAAEMFDCLDFQQLLIGNLFTVFSRSIIKSQKEVKFLLATKSSRKAVEIHEKSWQELKNIGFDPSRKTYFFIHGYQSNVNKEWVTDSLSELFRIVDVNIILVDWQRDSSRWNYVDAVKLTPTIRDEVVKFLRRLKDEAIKLGDNSKSSLWNRLYLIGHSLGAHISGQIGHTLKPDKFFKVERITGLDPAQPCFSRCPLHLRLDKHDAAYVDVVHTQTGNNEHQPDGFGFKAPLGHADFYVSGGIMQPKCEKTYSIELQKMICSHKIACEYFVESLTNARTHRSKFYGYKWNQTYANAVEIMNKSSNEKYCSSCAEMGFNADKLRRTGVFLVFVAAESPYGKIDKTDTPSIKKTIERLKKSTLPEPEHPLSRFDDPDGPF